MTATSSRTNGFLFADLRDYTQLRRVAWRPGCRGAARRLSLARAFRRRRFRWRRDQDRRRQLLRRLPVGQQRRPVRPGDPVCGGRLHGRTRASRSGSASVSTPVRRSRRRRATSGSAVNVAARVCSQAKPGELLVTDTVRALTRTFLPVRFVDRRVRRLKGRLRARRDVPGGVRPRNTAASRAAAAAGLRRRPICGRARHRPADRLGRRGLRARCCAAPGRDAIAVTPSASTALQRAFPTAAEADLLDQVPSSLRDRCVRAEADAAPGRDSQPSLRSRADGGGGHRLVSPLREPPAHGRLPEQRPADPTPAARHVRSLRVPSAGQLAGRRHAQWQRLLLSGRRQQLDDLVVRRRADTRAGRPRRR